jgi:hypothetical protein
VLCHSITLFSHMPFAGIADSLALNIMPEVFDFTHLGVSACRESAMRRFRRDHEPVAVVTRGTAAIIKLDAESFIQKQSTVTRCHSAS